MMKMKLQGRDRTVSNMTVNMKGKEVTTLQYPKALYDALYEQCR